jgi:hypothetical protein
VTGVTTLSAAPGTPLDQFVPYGQFAWGGNSDFEMNWDAPNQRWIGVLDENRANSVAVIDLNPSSPYKNSIYKIATLNQYAVSTAYWRDTAHQQDIIYYCGVDGHLYKHPIDISSGSPVDDLPETQYSFGTTYRLGVPNMSCTGYYLYRSIPANRNSLMFEFSKGPLYGMAEIVNP